MWEATVESLVAGHRYRLSAQGSPLSTLRLLELLQADERFAHWLTGIVATSPYPAVYWELPPLCESTLDAPAEFVLLDAPGLSQVPEDPLPFSEHFEEQAHDDVVVFPNLGGDAWLVVPKPRTSAHVYAHLAEFARHGPRGQVRSLWRTTAATVTEKIGTEPLWLSTAGDGVAWLHLRLDSRPKYYRHRPYVTPP